MGTTSKWSGLWLVAGLYAAFVVVAHYDGPQSPVLSQIKPVPVTVNVTQLDTKLINAVIYIESRGRANAVSNKGAVGIMQVMPSTAAQYGISRDELFDPSINRSVGSQYLATMIAEKGSVRSGLAAYNCGPNQNLPECNQYADMVLRVYDNQ